MDSRKDLGDFGERLAAGMLMRNGCRIRARQARTPYGEIDLVAEKGDLVIFVEVKTRRTTEYGTPEEAITAAKREHIARSVEAYRQREGLLDRPFRVDVVAIVMDEATRKATIRHIPNALET